MDMIGTEHAAQLGLQRKCPEETASILKGNVSLTRESRLIEQEPYEPIDYSLEAKEIW